MLVVTRSPNEETLIYDGDKLIMQIMVVKVEKNRVRIGFTGDMRFKIVRREIVDQFGLQAPSPTTK